MNAKGAAVDHKSPLEVRSGFSSKATRDISGALNALLADFFALYLNTKNFHWHVSGPHFRDYHLFLDEQADQLFATTDVIAERVRKIGGTTLRSIGHVARLRRVSDNDADYVTPLDMLASCGRKTRGSPRGCARPTACATSTAMSPPRTCSRSGSTRPRDAPGSSSRRADSAKVPAGDMRGAVFPKVKTLVS